MLELFGAMKEAGEVPAGAEADIKEGDVLEFYQTKQIEQTLE